MHADPAARFVRATPVLPSLDIARTVAFYCSTLGFTEVHAAPREYAIVEREGVQLHFWFTDDAALPPVSACRIEVDEIDGLHARCLRHGIVHPNGSLADKPWGTREFAVMDPDGNLLTFHRRA